MKCVNCGADLEPGVLFCKECGNKVNLEVRFCRECGTQLADGVRYCSNCGADTEVINKIGKEDYAKQNRENINEKKNPYEWIGGKPQMDGLAKNIGNIARNIDRKTKRTLYLIIGIILLLIIGVAIKGGSSSGENENQGNSTIVKTIPQDVPYTITKGMQYAYMVDEWNVYIATAVSDSLVKIEAWDKSSSDEKKVKYDSDIGTYKINDEENGFGWLDEEHTAFVINFKDDGNSKLKKNSPHIFTVNINDSDENKGSNYDEAIACYTYVNDDWHSYKAIPLTDNLIKIECWYKHSGFFSDKILYSWDWCVIDTSSSDTDFEWTDAEHTSFTITTSDPQNSSWDNDKFVVFEISNSSYKYKTVYDFLNPSDADTRSQKNGFDNSDNSSVIVGNYEFKIPSYWDADTIEKDKYRAYAETSGKVAMINIACTVDEDIVSYEALEAENEDGSMQDTIASWFDEAKDISYEPYDNGIIKGTLYSVRFVQQELDGSCKILCFPSIDENKWYFVFLSETDNTEYKYDEDFFKILDSITMASQDEEAQTQESLEDAQNDDSVDSDNTSDSNDMPIMSGTSIDDVVKVASQYDLSEQYEDNFGHGTKMKAFSDSSGGLMMDVIYSSSTSEILCATITTNKLVDSTTQKNFVKGIAGSICPSVDSSDISSWVSSNVGKNSKKEVNGFTYELSLGPVDNVLYYAGEKEWSTWDSKQ